MFITCLDLEGVLVPEIWIAFADASGIPELRITTRDEPDYDKLMKYRINILKEHKLGLKEIFHLLGNFRLPQYRMVLQMPHHFYVLPCLAFQNLGLVDMCVLIIYL